MRPIAIVILSATMLLTFRCGKSKNSTCPDTLIAEIKSENVTNPPSSIWQYEFNGQTVYYIPPVCCDVPSQLFDSDCKKICAPDGGISGAGDGKCPDFLSNRKNEKLIWTDDRK